MASVYLLPIIIFVFHRIKQHYQAVGEQLRLNHEELATIEGMFSLCQ